MKKKVSVSIGEEVIQRIEKKVDSGLFRNKSHLVEYAVISLLNERDNEGKDGA